MEFNIEWDLLTIEYYVANIVGVILTFIYKDKLSKIAKGPDGKYQREEVTWLICLYFFVFYGLRIVFLDIEANPAFLAAVVAGLGIGLHYSQKKPTVPTASNSTPPAG